MLFLEKEILGKGVIRDTLTEEEFDQITAAFEIKATTLIVRSEEEIEAAKKDATKKPSSTTPTPSPKVIPVVYHWSREAKNGFEVSSAGDQLGKMFSALNATLKDGRTVEEAYQLDVKGYRETFDKWLAAGNTTYMYNGRTYDMRNRKNHWVFGKGKSPVVAISKQESIERYTNLWKQFAQENPSLMIQLMKAANGKTLTDKFASTDVSQAHSLSIILNEALVNPSLLNYTDEEIKKVLDNIDGCNN